MILGIIWMQKIMKKCYSLPQTKMLEVAANQMICASGSQGGGGGATQPVSIKKATTIDVSFD